MTSELKDALEQAYLAIAKARSDLQVNILDMEDDEDDDTYLVTRADDDVVGGLIDIERVIERLLREA